MNATEMERKFQPIQDRLLVRKLKPRRSGIIQTPKIKDELKMMGEVLKIGPACTLVKPGDHVIFENYRGTEICADEDLVVMREPDIKAVADDLKPDDIFSFEG